MKTTKEKIEVMQSFLEGKKIQLYDNGSWCDWHGYEDEPHWDWQLYDYRVKSEVKQKVKRWLWAYKGKSDLIWSSCIHFMTEDEAKYKYGFAEIIKIESSMIEVDE